MPGREARGRFVTFPSGSVKYGAEDFYEVGKAYGGGWDVDIIAEAYRREMGERLARLTGIKLERSWKGFCEAYFARRGRP